MRSMDDLTRRGFLAGLAAGAWCWPRRDWAELPTAGGRFDIAARPAGDEPPLFATGFLRHDPAPAYAHCPSLAALPDGRLACVWYAGSREGAEDVALWWADLAAADVAAGRCAWAAPRAVVNRRSAERDLSRFVKKVGNPVLFTDATGRPWIVFVTIAVGGWSGSSLNACCSNDGGDTWEPIRRLTLSPFLNVSELVRAAPVPLDGGRIGLPVYHECIGKFPEMLWLRAEGDGLVATKSRMAWGRSLIQPAVVPLDATRGIALMRDHSSAHRVAIQRTADTGRTWSAPRSTTLPNPDASVAAVLLPGGRVLVAFNDSETTRDNLCLAVTESGGVTADDPRDGGGWRRIATLEAEPGAKFAYPYLIVDGAGRVHLTYSWKMQLIRHAVFNEAWLDAQAGEPIAVGRGGPGGAA